jgi:alpha-L-rhamnosidase
VTALVRANGANALGLTLAGGMYNVRAGRYVKFETLFRPLKAILQLRLEYADDSVELVGTDEQWKLYSGGPVTFSNVYGGEDYDARALPAGWDLAGFNDASWTRATVTEGPGGVLRGASHAAAPIGTHDVFRPVAVKVLRPGVTVYDLGQNVSLIPRLRVRGAAGGVVRIIPAELVKADGSVDRGSCSRGEGLAWWQYTLRGADAAAVEEWFPQFFYHGSRYLQVELTAGSDGALPVVESLEGVVVHTTSAPAGEFACSNELFNRIRTLVRWAQRSNLMSVITDCPHREKLGWLEQYHLNGPALRYEFDLTRLFAKTFGDMADAQIPSGLVPDIAPEFVIFSHAFRDSPEWGSAIILAAWQQYEFTGDDTPLRLYYDAMQRYVAYLSSKAEGDILSYGLGDWYDIGPKPPGISQLTPIGLTATAVYYEDVKTLGAIATILGKPDEARAFAARSGEIRAAFNRRFFDTGKGLYATGSQCANAIALVFDLVATADRPRVVNALVEDVQARGLTAGDVGYRYLLRALADGGRSEVIFAMNNQSEKPGYGYQLAHGATSLTEAWNTGRSSSQNHFMLGQIVEWFYHDLAGIAPDPAAPGFKHVVIRPQPTEDLTWASGSYETPRGLVSSAWKRENGRFTLDVTIPPGASATVYVPCKNPMAVKESGAGVPPERFPSSQAGTATFKIGSGHYTFVAAD